MIYTYAPHDLGGLEVRVTDPETGRYSVAYVAAGLAHDAGARRHTLERLMAAHGRSTSAASRIPRAHLHDDLMRRH